MRIYVVFSIVLVYIKIMKLILENWIINMLSQNNVKADFRKALLHGFITILKFDIYLHVVEK